MQDNEQNLEVELDKIIIADGWIQNVPKLASIGGLAAALAFGNTAQAKGTKPVNVSNTKKVNPIQKNDGKINKYLYINSYPRCFLLSFHL
jgi:hypothetical protein